MSDRHTVVPAAYLILRRGDTVLLARRANTGYCDGQYGLVSGHIDRGESCFQAAIREAYEEVGIVIAEKDLQIAHVLHRQHDLLPGDSDRVEWFFFVDTWQGDITNKEPHKCDDVCWFSLDALPDNTIAYLKHVFEQIQKGNFISSYGF